MQVLFGNEACTVETRLKYRVFVRDQHLELLILSLNTAKFNCQIIYLFRFLHKLGLELAHGLLLT